LSNAWDTKENQMTTLQQMLVGLFILATVAVVVSNGMAARTIGDAGNFLVGMVSKIMNS
jgi:hypothetical protein